MELKQCQSYHPPIITIFLLVVCRNRSQSWVVYGIVLPTTGPGPPCKIQDQIIRFGGRTEGAPWALEVGDRGKLWRPIDRWYGDSYWW